MRWPRRRTREPETPLRRLLRVGTTVTVTVAVLLMTQQFVARPYSVPTGSMYPAIHPGDTLAVDRAVYRFHPPQRGDVVVIGTSEAARISCDIRDDIPLAKRIIGLPGDIVYLPGNGSTWVNGVEMNIPNVGVSSSQVAFPVVPPGHVLVLGDNREDSCDARSWYDTQGNFAPFLPMRNIIGRADAVLWPPARIGRMR